jgi:hypothetical protein
LFPGSASGSAGDLKDLHTCEVCLAVNGFTVAQKSKLANFSTWALHASD